MGLKINFQPLSAEELRTRLSQFESRYGVPSERLADAFRDADGQLRETDDFLDWSQAYAAWRLINEA